MIVRLVLVAVVTAALLAASLPAIAVARDDRTEATVEKQLRDLAERLRTFVAANDPTRPPSARRVETITLPSRSLTSAGVERIRFRTEQGTGVASATVGSGTRSTVPLVDIPILSGDGPFTLTRNGSHRLVFELGLANGTGMLTVDRLRSPSSQRGHDA